jgi:hypothetical protein
MKISHRPEEFKSAGLILAVMALIPDSSTLAGGAIRGTAKAGVRSSTTFGPAPTTRADG